MTRCCLGLVVAAAALAGCNSDHAPGTAAGPAAPTPPGTSAPSPSPPPSQPTTPSAPADPAAAPPEGQRCLPVNVCDEWAGCGLVAPAPKFWKVIVADRFAPGDIVDVTSVCTSGDTCVAIRGIPKGVQCKPMTTPIYIKPPDYRCVWDGKTCHRG